MREQLTYESTNRRDKYYLFCFFSHTNLSLLAYVYPHGNYQMDIIENKKAELVPGFSLEKQILIGSIVSGRDACRWNSCRAGTRSNRGTFAECKWQDPWPLELRTTTFDWFDKETSRLSRLDMSLSTDRVRLPLARMCF